MDTLSHANPFFVRCIKSNADKMPNHFDDRLVLMQLRYTGMLETVRIRQSGYSVRLTFDEFIQHYRILLPKGLLSSKMDVQQFLLSMKLQPNMYQIGNTKVFMRESEKLVLDERLHEEILRRIINLQRWVSLSPFAHFQTQTFTNRTKPLLNHCPICPYFPVTQICSIASPFPRFTMTKVALNCRAYWPNVYHLSSVCNGVRLVS